MTMIAVLRYLFYQRLRLDVLANSVCLVFDVLTSGADLVGSGSGFQNVVGSGSGDVLRHD